MKIMQVIPYFCFGGAETMCENLTYGLRALGHEVVVVSLYGERTPIAQRMEAAGISIRYLDKKLGLDLSMIPKLRSLMAEERPQVVHTHLDVIKYAVAAARLAGIKTCVHTIHNMADKEAEGRLQKLVNGTYFRLGWAVPVALSAQVQSSVLDLYRLKEERVPVVYNGVDLSRCIPKADYRLREAPVLLHIGRFNEQKNHAMLLKAFASLRKTWPGCCLRLVGEGELQPQMEKLAAELGIADGVAFCGPRQDVHPELTAADVFLLPSRYEGMPMTIIEAMGTGLPIVAAQVGGVPDMLGAEEEGLLIPCQEEALRAAMDRLLKDEALRRRLGTAARAGAQRFSALGMARAYEAVYRKA